jgi:hypothetical protein
VKLDIMSFEDPHNPEIESGIVKKQREYERHLRKHGIDAPPVKAEFLMLFCALLESKIKSKIITEINNPSFVLTYLDELPTLITRSNPFPQFYEEMENILSENNYAEKDFFVELEKKFSEKSLGEVVSLCNTYNSPKRIFTMLSDFALFRFWQEGNPNPGKFDLHNKKIFDFIYSRNLSVHDLLNAKIDDVEFIQNNLDKILTGIVGMIKTALEVRRKSIDNVHSANRENVRNQLSWLNQISNETHPEEKLKFFYSSWFKKQKKAKTSLREETNRLIEKLEGDPNV